VTDTPTEREAESTWTRLRRRKVVQWGVVYVAAARGFLQGREYLSGTYDWPRQIQQCATLVALIGLPVVLDPSLRYSRCCYSWAVGRYGTTSGRARPRQSPLRPLRARLPSQPMRGSNE
jgi:hypothetical protein